MIRCLILASLTIASSALSQTAPAIDPSSLPRIATIDERFQSYNIEMVEVTGGRFWKPYDSVAKPEATAGNQPAGLAASLYEYRPPIDLSNPRLRKMAAALGPAYVRVSGTWANTTWFQSSDGAPPTTPPAGFKAVLTRAQWKGVIDFSNAANAKIVTSFAVSDGTRDASGVWTPAQARALVDFTKSSGGSIAAAEFMNEPTFPQIGGAPASYNAAAFARDLTVFRTFLKQSSPQTILLGPGGVAEGALPLPPGMSTIKSEDILAATGPVFDAFSYHTYGAVSSRCAPHGAPGGISPDAALSGDWLSRGAASEAFYAALRDRFTPGKPMWLTETAEAACGGDRFASTFLDTFRYLNQLGSLARRGVQVHMHNTLAASDYGLLDEKTYQPRPNYWAALLWHRLMGATVLDTTQEPSPSLHVYAHCTPAHAGSVTLLAINADADHPHSIAISKPSQRYTLTAHSLSDKQLLLNGVVLKLGDNDALPTLKGSSTPAGSANLAPASITFFVVSAQNKSCK